MDHRIGKAELGWMLEHWPRLERMHGPHIDKIRDCDRDREQAKKEPREYAQELKPGLVHETLFKFPGIVI